MTNSPISTKKLFISLAAFVTSLLLLQLLSLHNGFPLLLADSKSYLMMGLKFLENSHWSNTYIYFVGKNIEVFKTLSWLPMIQNLLILSVIYSISRLAFSHYNNLKYLIVIAGLLFTALPWISNVIMSDISTTICLLIILMVINYKLSRGMYLWLCILFFAVASWHQSHIAILPLFTAFIICIKLSLERKYAKEQFLRIIKSIIPLFVLFIASFWLEKNILNQPQLHTKTKIQKKSKPKDITSGYYFVGVRMWEVGELDNLLATFCPDNAGNYLCDPNNPFQIKIKLNKAVDRKQENIEYQKFSSDNKEFALACLTIPRFYYALFKAALLRSPKLLKHTEIPDYYPLEGITLKRNLKRVSKKEWIKFSNSRQYQGSYIGPFISRYAIVDKIWWLLILPVSVLIFVYLRFKFKGQRILSNDMWITIISLFAAHIINTVICGTFSNAENVRYSARTIWLINLAIILLLLSFNEFRINHQSSQDETNRTDTLSE